MLPCRDGVVPRTADGPLEAGELKSYDNAGFDLQTNGNGAGRGTCIGDSGSPVFYPANSNTVVAVTSFGMNEWCRGTDFAYRIDQQAVLSWIAAPVDQG